MLALWAEGRTRLDVAMKDLQEVELSKHLPGVPNSVGYLLRHIADVELLFAKNVFHLPNVQVVAKSLIDGKDTGVWTNLAELTEYLNQAAITLKQAIQAIPDHSWQEVVETKEFGAKSRTQALGRISTHTAYHAGQLALIRKYGS